MKRQVTLTSILLAAALLMGCPPPDPPEGNGMLLGLIVTPNEPVVPVGGDIQMLAYAYYQSGDYAEVTESVNWGVAEGIALSIGNGLDGQGVATGIYSGTAQVICEMDGVLSDRVTVRVTDADVLSLEVAPEDMELFDGESAWLTATADFSDGTRGDFSGSVRWITGDPDIVTLAADGRATAMNEGTTQVRAEYDGVSAPPATIVVRMDDGSESDSEDPWDDNDDPFGDDDDDDTDPVGDDDDDDPIGDDDDDPIGDDDDDDTGAPGQPNLEITYFDAYVGDGETFFYIDVTNTGTADCDGFWVDLFTDPWWAPEVGDGGDYFDWVEGLDAGETIYVDFGVGSTPWFGWGSYAILDTIEDVDESDEDDNIEGPLDV
jgi:hypothetical protein